MEYVMDAWTLYIAAYLVLIKGTNSVSIFCLKNNLMSLQRWVGVDIGRAKTTQRWYSKNTHVIVWRGFIINSKYCRDYHSKLNS